MRFTFPWFKPDLCRGQIAACLYPVTRHRRSQHKASCHSSMPSVGSKESPEINEKRYQNKWRDRKWTRDLSRLFINLQRGECIRRIRPRDTRIKGLSRSNWVQFKSTFPRRWKNNFHVDIHKIKLLQLSSFCICVIYYQKFRSGTNAMYVIIHIHICTEPWSFTPWYIFLAAWNKRNEYEWMRMNINEY